MRARRLVFRLRHRLSSLWAFLHFFPPRTQQELWRSPRVILGVSFPGGLLGFPPLLRLLECRLPVAGGSALVKPCRKMSIGSVVQSACLKRWAVLPEQSFPQPSWQRTLAVMSKTRHVFRKIFSPFVLVPKTNRDFLSESRSLRSQGLLHASISNSSLLPITGDDPWCRCSIGAVRSLRQELYGSGNGMVSFSIGYAGLV